MSGHNCISLPPIQSGPGDSARNMAIQKYGRTKLHYPICRQWKRFVNVAVICCKKTDVSAVILIPEAKLNNTLKHHFPNRKYISLYRNTMRNTNTNRCAKSLRFIRTFLKAYFNSITSWHSRATKAMHVAHNSLNISLHRHEFCSGAVTTNGF